MPATSPRLSITVSDDTYVALKRLSAAQGRPLGALVREYLEMATPALLELAGAMEAMRIAQDAARSELASSLGEAQADLEPHLNGILGHLRALADMAEGDSHGEVDGGAVGPAARSKAA